MLLCTHRIDLKGRLKSDRLYISAIVIKLIRYKEKIECLIQLHFEQ